MADLTSKISLLEDAKKKKEEEAVQWQEKVRSYLSLGKKRVNPRGTFILHSFFVLGKSSLC